MKENKSKIILIIAILAVATIIALVCNGFIKGSKKPVATLEVSYIGEDGSEKTGTIKIELDKDAAPITVANFINLANNGFYDGLTFHRIMSDFMIQGGDPEGTGSGSVKLSKLDKKVAENSSEDHTYAIKGEFLDNGVSNPIKFEKGVIAMARGDYSSYGLYEEGYNSASSQFFIVTTDNESTLNNLNGQYAPFGKVIEGYDVVEAIANVQVKESDSGEESSPVNAPIIKSIRVDTNGVKYDVPSTINFEETQSKVQMYDSYYKQLMSSYSTSESTDTEAQVESANE